MTTRTELGSHFLHFLILPAIFMGCGRTTTAEAEPTAPPPIPTAPSAQKREMTKAPAAEVCLGVSDKGIWSDLDEQVQIVLPKVAPERVTARVDDKRKLLVLAIDGFPRKVYPLGGAAKIVLGARTLAVRPGDRAELATLLAPERVTDGAAAHDRDGDGIPDPLDVLIGAKKTALNADDYTEGYMEMTYPGGDVPRKVGVCTDVIIRAARNAGYDIQRELHEDIARARAAYPMIKGNGDYKIDQRRVKTLLPYFQRHWQAHTARVDDAKDPLRPGDVIFMDTFPTRDGPDHIGIVSDTIGESGMPVVINNWTNGTVTREMDLLGSVPVLYRFRLPE